MENIIISKEIVEAICKYCEDKAIYDKLGHYKDFYYKIKKILNNKNIKIGDIIINKKIFNLGGKVIKVSKDYIWYDDFDGVRKSQPIHTSNLKNYNIINLN